MYNSKSNGGLHYGFKITSDRQHFQTACIIGHRNYAIPHTKTAEVILGSNYRPMHTLIILV